MRLNPPSLHFHIHSCVPPALAFGCSQWLDVALDPIALAYPVRSNSGTISYKALRIQSITGIIWVVIGALFWLFIVQLLKALRLTYAAVLACSMDGTEILPHIKFRK